jgi:ADP-heptose:LPS heptosyltransferase
LKQSFPNKILLVRGGAMGDFILTLPVLAALRRHFPASLLEILGHEGPASLAVAAGLVGRVSPLESPAMAGFFVRGGVWPARVAEYFAGFDLIVSYVYDREEIFQSNVRRCSAAKFVAGPHRPDETSDLHAAQSLLRPLKVLGIDEADPRPRLMLPGPAEYSPDKSLAVHPGSGSLRKNWPEAKWAQLLKRLAAESKWHFLLIGGEAEGARCQRLAADLPPHRTRLAENLPLAELAQRMRSCAAFIGHDSGVTHLAAALGLPGLVLWGPTNQAVWRPLSDRIGLLHEERGLKKMPVETVFQQAQIMAQ